MEWDKLWTINKKIIDPVCPRHTAVSTQKKVLLDLSNGPDAPFTRVILRHKKYEGAGKKATVFTKRIWLDQADGAAVSEGEEVTLMDWGNAIISKVEKDENGLVMGLKGQLHLEGSVKSTKLKLTWLPETTELVPLTLVELDHLITKKKVLFLPATYTLCLTILLVILCSFYLQLKMNLVLLLVLESARSGGKLALLCRGLSDTL